MSLQSFDSVILSQDLHLAYSDGIEFCQPFGLRHPLAKAQATKRKEIFLSILQIVAPSGLRLSSQPASCSAG